MTKKEILNEQKICFESMTPVNLKEELVKGVDYFDHDSSSFFKNTKDVVETLLACLLENDQESFIEVLEAYLEVNKGLQERSPKEILGEAYGSGVYNIFKLIAALK